jgi:hypothetical protein
VEGVRGAVFVVGVRPPTSGIGCNLFVIFPY